jgi:DNA-binding MarR family transcriptional regulator
MSYLQKNSSNSHAFTPKAALDFAFLIEKQAEQVYGRFDIRFPVITSSTMHFIGLTKEASLADVAKALEIPHQLASQRIKLLLELEMIQSRADEQDKRRTLYSLTKLGKRQYILLEKYLESAEQVFQKLNEALGINLLDCLQEAKRAFIDSSLNERILSLD